MVYKFRVRHLRLCPSACSQYQGLPKQWVSLSNEQTQQSKNLGPQSASPYENLNMAEEEIIKTVKPQLSLRTADVFPVVASLFSEEEKQRPEIRLRFAG